MLPDSITDSQPHSVAEEPYRAVMASDIKKVVRDNTLALLGLAPGERGATAELVRLGLSNGDATRVLKAETSLGLDKIVQIANGLRVQPWQLLVPGLDPERLPALEQISFRWPFRNVDPEVITELVGTSAQQVENGLLATLATAGIAPRRAMHTPHADKIVAAIELPDASTKGEGYPEDKPVRKAMKKKP